MAGTTDAHPPSAGYAARPVTKAPNWHDLVAWDMLFNNLTTGLFLVAAVGEFLAPDVFTSVAKAAYPLALAFLLTDLVCLVLDLGDPMRFHHMLRIIKLSSPMSLGTWCLTIYSLPLTATALLSIVSFWMDDVPHPALEWGRKAAVLLAIIPALGSAAYKGVLLSTNSQPGWKDARWLGGYLTNSGILLGCAGMLALAVLMKQEKAIVTLRVAVGLLLVLNTVLLCSLFANLRPALARIYTSKQIVRMGVLNLGGGIALPLVLVILGDSAYLLLVAVACLLFGSLTIRFQIIKIPHEPTITSG